MRELFDSRENAPGVVFGSVPTGADGVQSRAESLTPNLEPRVWLPSAWRKADVHGVLWEAVALWFTDHNLCRIHRTLRFTQAREAELSDHV